MCSLSKFHSHFFHSMCFKTVHIFLLNIRVLQKYDILQFRCCRGLLQFPQFHATFTYLLKRDRPYSLHVQYKTAFPILLLVIIQSIYFCVYFIFFLILSLSMSIDTLGVLETKRCLLPDHSPYNIGSIFLRVYYEILVDICQIVHHLSPYLLWLSGFPTQL